jgi:hypothetical protein
MGDRAVWSMHDTVTGAIEATLTIINDDVAIDCWGEAEDLVGLLTDMGYDLFVPQDDPRFAEIRRYCDVNWLIDEAVQREILRSFRD